MREVSPGPYAGKRRLSLAPRQKYADFRPRAALSAVDRLRCGGAASRRGAGRHRAEIQSAGTSGYSTRIRSTGRSRSYYAAPGGTRRGAQDVEEPGKLRWYNRTSGSDVRKADVDL